MITVSILINGQPIITRSATRKSLNRQGIGTYDVDTGDRIKHKVSDGAIKLAKKMLDTVCPLDGKKEAQTWLKLSKEMSKD